MRSIYRDGTNLFTGNTGSIRNEVQDYQFSTTGNFENQSVYIRASLQNTQRDYGLHTASNEALESNQQLQGDNRIWQLNFSYHKKVGEGALWSTTFGYFNQNGHENLQTNPDLLFWLFPHDLSLYALQSHTNVKLTYAGLKSTLLLNRRRMTHDIGLSYTRETRHFGSHLITQSLTNHLQQTPFENNNTLRNPALVLSYKGGLRLTEKKRLTLSLSNKPHFLNYREPLASTKETRFFYDYSAGINAKHRTSDAGFTLGVKRQPAGYDLFFPEFVQTGFHRLQSGVLDRRGKRSTYMQASYNLFSVRMGWMAFFLLNLSRDKVYFVWQVETKGVATVQSFSYYPNSTNQLLFIFNSRKTIGEWPVSLHSNILYNRQGALDGFNGKLNRSDFQYFNSTLGFKSLFKSFINFDYRISLSHSKNTIRSQEHSSRSSHTILNKLLVYVVQKKLFHSTITVNNMVSRNGVFEGTFLDLSLNRKFIKDKFMVEADVRNIFNKRFIENTMVMPFYTRENRVGIRGAEFFVKLRYEIR